MRYFCYNSLRHYNFIRVYSDIIKCLRRVNNTYHIHRNCDHNTNINDNCYITLFMSAKNLRKVTNYSLSYRMGALRQKLTPLDYNFHIYNILTMPTSYKISV